MKMTLKPLLLLLCMTLCSCGSEETNGNTNSHYDEQTETHNYVKASELTILKNVSSTKIKNYFEQNANQKIYKENLTLGDQEASTWFNEVCTDDTFYYWMYDGYQNNGRVINLKEIWFFPEAELFVLKNQTNTYDTLTAGGNTYAYKYQHTAETAVKIGMKADKVPFGGTYYQECVNLSNLDAAGYLVNMTFSIPVLEPPSDLPEANKTNCSWQVVSATNFSEANRSFQSDQTNLCTKSYNCLTGVFYYLSTKISAIDSTYKIFSK